jgi:hypothetical protein
MNDKNDKLMEILSGIILITAIFLVMIINTGCKPEDQASDGTAVVEQPAIDAPELDEPIASETCDMTQDHNSEFQVMNEDCCHKLAEFDWRTSTYTLRFRNGWGRGAMDSLSYRITCVPGYDTCTDNWGATREREGFPLVHEEWDETKQSYIEKSPRCYFKTDHAGNFLSVKWNNVELKQ